MRHATTDPSNADVGGRVRGRQGPIVELDPLGLDGRLPLGPGVEGPLQCDPGRHRRRAPERADGRRLHLPLEADGAAPCGRPRLRIHRAHRRRAQAGGQPVGGAAGASQDEDRPRPADGGSAGVEGGGRRRHHLLRRGALRLGVAGGRPRGRTAALRQSLGDRGGREHLQGTDADGMRGCGAVRVRHRGAALPSAGPWWRRGTTRSAPALDDNGVKANRVRVPPGTARPGTASRPPSTRPAAIPRSRHPSGGS
jgi:hypothetical protein